MFTVTISGLQESFFALERSLESDIERALLVIENDVAETARRSHAFQNRTGDLEASIQPGPAVGSFLRGSLRGDVRATTPYGSYVEAMPDFAFLEPAWRLAEGSADETLQRAVQSAVQAAGW